VFGLFDEGDLHAQLRVGKAELGGSRSAGEIDGIVGWRHGAPGQDGVELHLGMAPQLNSKAGPVESISAVVPSTPPKM
jgi:hypothetical protein